MKFKLLKKHKKESNKWLSRHINDEFVLKSKKEGFRFEGFGTGLYIYARVSPAGRPRRPPELEARLLERR